MFEISRRDLVLGAAGAYATFGINRPVTFIGAALAEESVTQPFRKYRLGDIEVFSLIDGMRDIPLREGMVRNVGVEQVKTVLHTAGLPPTVYRHGAQAARSSGLDRLGHGRTPNLW
jgi:hypothetical protein